MKHKQKYCELRRNVVKNELPRVGFEPTTLYTPVQVHVPLQYKCIPSSTGHRYLYQNSCSWGKKQHLSEFKGHLSEFKGQLIILWKREREPGDKANLHVH